MSNDGPHTRETYLGNGLGLGVYLPYFWGLRKADCGPTEPTTARELNRRAVLATIAHTPRGPEKRREPLSEPAAGQTSFEHYMNENKMRRSHMALSISIAATFLSMFAHRESSRKAG